MKVNFFILAHQPSMILLLPLFPALFPVSLHTVCAPGQLNFRLFSMYIPGCSIAPLAHVLASFPWYEQLIICCLKWLTNFPIRVEIHWIKGVLLVYLRSSLTLWAKFIWNIFIMNKCLFPYLIISSGFLMMEFMSIYNIFLLLVSYLSSLQFFHRVGRKDFPPITTILQHILPLEFWFKPSCPGFKLFLL